MLGVLLFLIIIRECCVCMLLVSLSPFPSLDTFSEQSAFWILAHNAIYNLKDKGETPYRWENFSISLLLTFRRCISWSFWSELGILWAWPHGINYVNFELTIMKIKEPRATLFWQLNRNRNWGKSLYNETHLSCTSVCPIS